MLQSLIPVLALAAYAAGTPHIIDVGKQGSLSFSPNSLTADVGDTLEFHFYSGSGGHSAVQSTLENPCVPSQGGFFSGYQAADSTGDTTFVVNVTSTSPIWFYCSLGSHCQSGMVGVVNPPAGTTITNYTDAAAQVVHASAPASPTGGTVTSIDEATETTQPGGPLQSATTTTSTSATGASVRSGVQATPTSTTSTGATPSPTKSESGRSNDLSVMLGLSIVVGGLVVLMA